MPPLFGCPCGQQFAVSPQMLGQKVRCPHCARVLFVPAPAAPPALVPPPVPAERPPHSSRGILSAVVVLLVIATGAGILLYQHYSAIPEESHLPQTRND